MMIGAGGIICSGNIVLDILVRPVGEIQWGVTQWVETMDQHLGGNAANTSGAIASLGVPARIVGAVGRDGFGEVCLGRLAAMGVNTAFLAEVAEPTASSVALVRESGARTFLHRPGASRVAFAAGGPEFRGALIEGAGHYHLANVFALPHLRNRAPEVLAAARAAGLSTSLDTAWDARGEWMQVLAPCLPELDVLFVNEDEARMLTGSGDPAAHAREFFGHGLRQVFVEKLGGAGCVIFTRDGGRHDLAAYPVKVVDTTGAGDCFAGAFLAALSRGLEWTDAGRVANAVGALVVEQTGGTTGLRSWPETMAWMERHRGTLG